MVSVVVGAVGVVVTTGVVVPAVAWVVTGVVTVVGKGTRVVFTTVDTAVSVAVTVAVAVADDTGGAGFVVGFGATVDVVDLDVVASAVVVVDGTTLVTVVVGAVVVCTAVVGAGLLGRGEPGNPMRTVS